MDLGSGVSIFTRFHEGLTGYGAGLRPRKPSYLYWIALLFHLGRRFANPTVGKVAAWMYALSPTQIFAQSLSECLSRIAALGCMVV